MRANSKISKAGDIEITNAEVIDEIPLFIHGEDDPFFWATVPNHKDVSLDDVKLHVSHKEIEDEEKLAIYAIRTGSRMTIAVEAMHIDEQFTLIRGKTLDFRRMVLGLHLLSLQDW